MTSIIVLTGSLIFNGPTALNDCNKTRDQLVQQVNSTPATNYVIYECKVKNNNNSNE